MKPAKLKKILVELRAAGVAEFSGLGLKIRFQPGAHMDSLTAEELEKLTPDQREARQILEEQARNLLDRQLEGWSVG